MLKNLKNQRGFTLIEILVVIGIIAILAVIVLIAINPARQFQQARDTQRTSNVNAILNAVGQYIADHRGEYPAGIPSGTTVLSATPINSAFGTAGGFCLDLVPTYIPALPVDPGEGEAIDSCTGTWDTGYEIAKSANGRITIIAPDTEVNDPDDNGTVDDIEVTR